MFQGFARETVGNWVCLANYESAYNTAASYTNTDASIDNGIFQINNNYWCDDVGASNDCNIACSLLRDDDITDDCDCAVIIWNRHGFDAWYGWLNNCDGVCAEPNVS